MLDHELVLDPAMARLALETAVDQLTLAPKIDRGDDIGVAEGWALVPAVEDAIDAANGTNGAPTAAGSRAPGRLAALSWLAELDRVVGRRPEARDRSRAARVRAWSAAMHGERPETLMWAVRTAEALVDRARRITEPSRTIALRGVACPSCGYDRVLIEGEEGEDVVATALIADLRDGAILCRAHGCEARWHPEEWAGLPGHLGRQLEHEVLAEE